MPLSTPVTQIVGRDVVSIDVNQTILDAIQILSQGRFHHLPVVDRKRLVGMLSTVDLLKLSGEVFSDSGSQKPARLASRDRVGDIMVTEVIPISARGTVEDAARLLSSGEYHALPIMAATGELVGIVTTTDLVKYLLETPAKPQAPEDVQARMQLLEKVYTSAQRFLDSGMNASARESLERTIHEARWAA